MASRSVLDIVLQILAFVAAADEQTRTAQAVQLPSVLTSVLER
jgi:hypothetical protein